jgi:tRNA pseudouridine55 synthase
MDGVLVIDKPAGITSHDVVADVRRILHLRRVGHTGTLDPFATGLLIILLGGATRIAQFLSGLEKEYEAVIRLGYATDTGDATGKPLPANEADSTRKAFGNWSREEIEAALASLRGDLDQVPPMYSAKKQGGRKLYELARRGEEVERKPVRICVHKFEAIASAGSPDGEFLRDNLDGTFDFKARVGCSAGTYIRTLAEDFGKQLGVGAHLAELRRTRIGDFAIEQAQRLGQLKEKVAEEALGEIVITTDEALARFPSHELGAEELRKVKNGMKLQTSNAAWADGERVRLRDADGHLIAVGEFDATAGTLHPRVVIARDN